MHGSSYARGKPKLLSVAQFFKFLYKTPYKPVHCCIYMPTDIKRDFNGQAAGM